MSKTFVLKILTPEKVVLSLEAEKVLTIAGSGDIEFMPDHEPTIVNTIPCVTKYTDSEGNSKALFTSKGVVSFSNNELTFCCESAELPEEIDIQRASEAKRRAEERLNDQKYDKNRAEYALIKANVRMHLKKHQ